MDVASPAESHAAATVTNVPSSAAAQNRPTGVGIHELLHYLQQRLIYRHRVYFHQTPLGSVSYVGLHHPGSWHITPQVSPMRYHTQDDSQHTYQGQVLFLEVTHEAIREWLTRTGSYYIPELDPTGMHRRYHEDDDDDDQ